MSIAAQDKKIIWHPFTQEKTSGPNVVIKSAAGSYLYDENGNAYLDCISSWWVNLHGHSHPFIANSIHTQALKLEHVIFAGFTHEPAVALCENMGKLLPTQLCKFFFSDNGSTSVEIALKMAHQYWSNENQNDKHLFLSFEGGYHGDTVGAMSIGNSSFHKAFVPLFFKTLIIPYPATHDGDTDFLLKEQNALAVLDQHLKQHGDKIAAIIIEPLIQGASGMRVCRIEFIQTVLKRLHEHGILVIFDEVMTGFGRTGSSFAFEQIGFVPDFLCLAKGLTGGFLPLALTLTTEKIYNAFLNNAWQYAFAHGHSYTANPLACAAAIASLQLLQQDHTQKSITSINQAHTLGLAYLKAQCKNIINTRVVGTISAFDVLDISKISKLFKEKCLQSGLLIRPLGDTIYLLPPYSTTHIEIKSAYCKIADILSEISFALKSSI